MRSLALLWEWNQSLGPWDPYCTGKERTQKKGVDKPWEKEIGQGAGVLRRQKQVSKSSGEERMLQAKGGTIGL